MAINFPASPTNGQVFNDPTSGQTWTWDGTKWTGNTGATAYWSRSGTTLSPATAGDAISGNLLPTNGAFGTRNRIINGDMLIDQRNNGGLVTITAGVTHCVDRWALIWSTTGKFTAQRQTNPSLADFFTCLQLTSSSAYTVPSNELYGVAQRIEGHNIADLKWGTASARSVTLSFWAFSSLTGTFGGSLRNSAANRFYPFSYSIPSANTWTRISITIPGDTTGTWLIDNGLGIEVLFSLGAGSGFTGTAGAWTASTAYAPTGAVNVVATNGATLFITGVQLEAGPIATPFERRSYGQELALCQRYFIAPYEYPSWYAPAVYSGAVLNAHYYLPVTMRVSPTLTGGWFNGQNAASGAIIVTRNLIQATLYATSLGVNFGAALLVTSLSAEL